MDAIIHKDKHNLKSTARKVWNFIWHSDSVWSWFVNIILAYVFIKFIFYPGLGLLFNTPYPLVAVVSGSMEHMKIDYDGNKPTLCGNQYFETEYFVNFEEYWKECGKWYEEHQITKEQFSGFLFKNGFNKGDIIFIYKTDPKNLKIGDVIVFQRGEEADPIIHRIVQVSQDGGKYAFSTKGDHNKEYGLIDINIPDKIVMGKGVFRVPYLGWIKIWFVDLIDYIRSLKNSSQ